MPSVEPGLVRCCSLDRRWHCVAPPDRSPNPTGVHFCQAEIENLGMSALGDKNIGGLDVAVNDPFGVGGIERVGNLDGER